MMWIQRSDNPDDLLTPGRRVLRTHARWLNIAIRRTDQERLRIPVRRVDRGGYSRMIATSKGREWARKWWSQTMSRTDLSL